MVYTTVSMYMLRSLCFNTISMCILQSLCAYHNLYVYATISMGILRSLCVCTVQSFIGPYIVSQGGWYSQYFFNNHLKFKITMGRVSWRRLAQHKAIYFMIRRPHRHLSNIDFLMACTTRFVCFIRTVNGRSKRGKMPWKM